MKKLDAKVRNLRLKPRKFRNAGFATGLIKRSNGDYIPIYLKGNEVDKFIKRYGDRADFKLNLEGMDIDVKITELFRHVVNHNVINLDLEEI